MGTSKYLNDSSGFREKVGRMHMETNETILTRDVVIIESQKVPGSVKSLRVDCDKVAVSHFIVNKDSAGAVLVLPFEKALSVGDAFVTVQKRDDFLPSNDAYSNKVIQDGYKLVKEEVFSKTGNKLGAVKSFEFETIYGRITSLTLEDGTCYSSDAIVFFSTDFIFVDDGALTSAELRLVEEAKDEVVEEVEDPTVSVTLVDEVAEEAAEVVAEVAEEVEVALEAAVEVAAEPEDDDDATISDEEILQFLIGTTLQADVESEDGLFKAVKGSVLTRQTILEAAKHDAILLLTINVEV
jgi:sporulation protein YlmC with PRC-barrel domain